MKHYLRLTENGIEQLGSDSYVPLDGRKTSKLSIKIAAATAISRLRIVRPNWNGANYYIGTLSDWDSKPEYHIPIELPGKPITFQQVSKSVRIHF